MEGTAWAKAWQHERAERRLVWLQSVRGPVAGGSVKVGNRVLRP